MIRRILIAGIGNIFCGDDAFGVEVAQAAMRRAWPESVHVVDFGIRAMDLAYALCDGGYDAAILVDTVTRGQPPGTLYVIEPEKPDAEAAQREGALPDGHAIEPHGVLRLAAAMGGCPRKLILLGCEPAATEPQEEACAMSPPVKAAVDRAVEILARFIGSLLSPSA